MGHNVKELHMEAKRKVEVGKVYSAKVGGTFLPVRIDRSLGHGRYEGVCLPDGKTVKIATDAVKGAGETIEQWEARRKPKEQEVPAAAPAAAPDKPKAAATPREKKDRKPSGLDAAVVVLAEAGKPMNCGDMVRRMLETGLWQTGGKTPSSTIYAAIITEISKKGAASRFRKTDRGMFELTEVGKGGK